MKYHYPKNVILDVKPTNSNYVNDYWVVNYSASFSKDAYFATSLNLISSKVSVASKLERTPHMSTVDLCTPSSYYSTLNASPKLVTSKAKKLRSLKASSSEDWAFNRYTSGSESTLGGNVSPSSPLSSVLNSNSPVRSRSLLNHLFDINFIKKERLYTKLKYSRSPAYDIVSGGAAALLAGFIGFLISEKFGIELVDSGDFYIGFMYAVLLALPCRLFLRMMSQSSSLWSIISPNYLLYYLADVVRLVVTGVSAQVVLVYCKLSSFVKESGMLTTSGSVNPLLIVVMLTLALLL